MQVKDSDNNIATDEIKINIINSSSITYNLSLSKGWNLISIPLILENSSIENIFSQVLDKTIVVYSFDKGAKTYVPELKEFSDLKTVDPYHGYWIKLNDSADLSVTGYKTTDKTVPLTSGWNLISYPLDYPKNITDVLSDIMNTIVIVKGFDNGALTFVPSLPYKFSDLKQMKPNFGYWIKINNSTQEISLKF